jgi:hypothetical protein
MFSPAAASVLATTSQFGSFVTLKFTADDLDHTIQVLPALSHLAQPELRAQAFQSLCSSLLPFADMLTFSALVQTIRSWYSFTTAVVESVVLALSARLLAAFLRPENLVATHFANKRGHLVYATVDPTDRWGGNATLRYVALTSTVYPAIIDAAFAGMLPLVVSFHLALPQTPISTLAAAVNNDEPVDPLNLFADASLGNFQVYSPAANAARSLNVTLSGANFMLPSPIRRR